MWSVKVGDDLPVVVSMILLTNMAIHYQQDCKLVMEYTHSGPIYELAFQKNRIAVCGRTEDVAVISLPVLAAPPATSSIVASSSTAIATVVVVSSTAASSH